MSDTDTISDGHGTVADAVPVTCDCGIDRCQGVTILVPVGCAPRGSARNQHIMAHNLVINRRLFGYPTID